MEIFGDLAIAVFERKVRAHFTADTPLAELASFSIGVRQSFRAYLTVSAIEIEMLIRAEFDEHVPIGDLSNERRLNAMIFIACILVHLEGLVGTELDNMLAAAERVRPLRS